MEIQRSVLISDLISMTQNHIQLVSNINLAESQLLNRKPNANGWSVLECIEHLNRYGRFYIPEIRNKLDRAINSSQKVFKSGWLGNYFALNMLPSPNMKAIKTFKTMDPVGSDLDREVINVFLRQQNEILTLLGRAEKVDLVKVKTSISISKLIKLRLGDTLRIVIYHNKRHILQAQKVLSNLEQSLIDYK